jgi:hypothetical protein
VGLGPTQFPTLDLVTINICTTHMVRPPPPVWTAVGRQRPPHVAQQPHVPHQGRPAPLRARSGLVAALGGRRPSLESPGLCGDAVTPGARHPHRSLHGVTNTHGPAGVGTACPAPARYRRPRKASPHEDRAGEISTGGRGRRQLEIRPAPVAPVAQRPTPAALRARRRCPSTSARRGDGSDVAFPTRSPSMRVTFQWRHAVDDNTGGHNDVVASLTSRVIAAVRGR